MKAARWL